MAQVPAPLLPKARRKRTTNSWPAALGIRASGPPPPPPTRHADTRWRLSRSIMRAACRQHTRVTRKPGFLLNTKPDEPRRAGPLSAGVGATPCSLILLAADRSLVRQFSRMKLDWGCETPGRSQVRARRAAGRASRTPLAESEERNVADGADPAEHEHVKREPVVQLRHRRRQMLAPPLSDARRDRRRHEGARARGQGQRTNVQVREEGR